MFSGSNICGKSKERHHLIELQDYSKSFKLIYKMFPPMGAVDLSVRARETTSRQLPLPSG
ncbi:MAG: hypothetical protein H6625_02085 [Bdellovibrionaceae bacterium]|nr:hypothetical protein [Pseudobdellovibrionaceae bacterium]